MKIFLGGVIQSNWRSKLMPILDEMDIEYFNPVVDVWTSECQEKEEEEKESSTYNLYVLSAKLIGVFTIAEVVDNSNDCPYKTLCLFLEDDDGVCYKEHTLKSIEATLQIIQDNGVPVFRSMDDLILYLDRSK
jgi:hypothetical protein